MTETPYGWSRIKIVDLLEPHENGKAFQQGWSPQCERTPAVDGAWGILKTTAIQEGEFLPFENKALPTTLEPRPHLEVKAGDILMTCAGPRNRCGVTCLVEKTRPKLMMSGKMYRFRPDTERLNSKYLQFFLHSRNAKQTIDRMKTGISDSGLNLTHGRFAELNVPLPPVGEQIRIVAKIEELHSELDMGIESLKMARKEIDLFYQSVLENCFADLIESKLLRDIISQKLSNGYSGKPVRYKTNYKVLSLSSTTSGVFDDSKFKYLDEEGLKRRDIWCSPNDILIQRGNTLEYVGVPAIYTGLEGQFIFPDLMIRARADEEKIMTKYLYYALASPKIRNYLRSKARGSAGTMPKISQAILNELQVPFCKKSKQEEIVLGIDERISNCFFVRDIIDGNLQKIDSLRQAILMKAFSGQLVAKDTDYESASNLLRQTRVEKEERTKGKITSKTKDAA